MKKLVSIFLCLTFLFGNIQAAVAGIVSSDSVVAAAETEQQRMQLRSLLTRDDVRQELEALGVDTADAYERVNSLSDAELQSMQGHLAEIEAGQDALGLIVFVFLVFVVTDVIGATDIFPFINSIR